MKLHHVLTISHRSCSALKSQHTQQLGCDLSKSTCKVIKERGKGQLQKTIVRVTNWLAQVAHGLLTNQMSSTLHWGQNINTCQETGGMFGGKGPGSNLTVKHQGHQTHPRAPGCGPWYFHEQRPWGYSNPSCDLLLVIALFEHQMFVLCLI